MGATWGTEEEKLLKFTLQSPTLHVRPHKSQSQTEFDVHRSPLDKYTNNDFYALWNLGKITKVFISEKDDEALVNLKKGLIGLFQYQLLDGDYTEEDVCGKCKVTYTSTSPTSYQKLKKSCQGFADSDKVYFSRPEVPLSLRVNSYRSTSFKVAPDGSLDTVESRDYHSTSLGANEKVGGSVDSLIALEWDGRPNTVAVITAKTSAEAVSTLKGLKEQDLVSSLQHAPAPDSTLKAIVKERLSDLDKSYLGTMTSAFALVDILPIAKGSDKKEIVQVLKARTTKEHLVILLRDIPSSIFILSVL